MKLSNLSKSLTLFVGACASSETMLSGEVNSEAIHQSYEFTYNENDNRVMGWAQFRAGGALGTTLELNQGAEVRFQGTPMNRRHHFIDGTYYDREEGAQLNPDSTLSAAFLFVDNDKKEFVNKIVIPKLIWTATKPESLESGDNLNLPMNNESTSNEEQIEVVIDQDSNHFSKTIQCPCPNEVIVSGSEIRSEIFRGAAKATVRKVWKSSAGSFGREGGQKRGVYKTSWDLVVK